MPCFCGEISRCESDINTLNQMIAVIADVKSCNEHINSLLTQMSCSAQGAFTPRNISTLCCGIEKGNNMVKNNTDFAEFGCAAQRAALRDKLSAMISSDIEYHSLED